MSHDFWKSPTYKIVQAILATGNGEGVVAQWKASVEAWANSQPDTKDKAGVRAWLPLWQARPFYTAAELAPILPALFVALGHREQFRPARSPLRVENRLRFFRLPILQNADGQDTFVHPVTGRYGRFFVVEKCHRWRNVALTQEEFSEAFHGNL